MNHCKAFRIVFSSSKTYRSIHSTEKDQTFDKFKLFNLIIALGFILSLLALGFILVKVLPTYKKNSLVNDIYVDCVKSTDTKQTCDYILTRKTKTENIILGD